MQNVVINCKIFCYTWKQFTFVQRTYYSLSNWRAYVASKHSRRGFEPSD